MVLVNILNIINKINNDCKKLKRNQCKIRTPASRHFDNGDATLYKLLIADNNLMRTFYESVINYDKLATGIGKPNSPLGSKVISIARAVRIVYFNKILQHA